MKALTLEQSKRLSELKRIRCERGFWLIDEEIEYTELVNKLASNFSSYMKRYNDELRIMSLN